MYKIYFNNKPLLIAKEKTPSIEEYLHHEETVFIDEFNLHTVKAMIHEMEAPQIQTGVFLHQDPDAVLNAFKKKLVTIVAAGGMVHTSKNEVLLIHRRGKWDLPKGKLDDKEELVDCAYREIKEETGLQQLQYEHPIITTYHTYHEHGKHILKESHWFLFSSPGQKEFVPQLEEDIDKCIWVPIKQLPAYMENTHASIIDVINAGLKLLHENKNA
jgi:8-oxo-dGTP pyrophosphatase MutT (NUDIX family)